MATRSIGTSVAALLAVLLSQLPWWAAIADSLKIGVVASLTGDFSLFGRDVEKGARLAAKEANASGQSVELIFEDDKCLPKDGLSAFKKLTEVDHVGLVVGSGCTGVITTIGPVAARAGIPVIALLDANELTTKAGNTTFVLGFDAAELAGVVAKEMYKRGHRRAAVLYETDAWAEFVRSSFAKAFAASGGSVVLEVEQNVADPDYRPALGKLAAASPDSLYIIPAYQGGRIIQQARRMGIKLPIFGPDTLGNAAALEFAGADANGIVFANIVLDETNTELSELLKKVAADPDISRASTKIDSPFYVALGYDAVRVGIAALSAGRPPLEYLAEVSGGFVNPVTSFNADRQAKVPPTLLVVEEGRAVQLKGGS